VPERQIWEARFLKAIEGGIKHLSHTDIVIALHVFILQNDATQMWSKSVDSALDFYAADRWCEVAEADGTATVEDDCLSLRTSRFYCVRKGIFRPVSIRLQCVWDWSRHCLV